MHTTEFELLDALAKPVCAVCSLARKSAHDYLAGVLADGVNDSHVREDWRQRGGLCANHWRVLRHLENPTLAAAILADDLLSHYLSQGRPASRRCRACQSEREAGRRYLEALRGIPIETVDKALASGRGFLCLDHWQALEHPGLQARFEARLAALLDELREFMRKQDYRYSHEPLGPERDSWLRAIRALGGDA